MRCASTPRACTCRASTSCRGTRSARAELRGYGDDGKRFRQLVIHTDALRGTPMLRRYERFVFGPWAGLIGSKDKVVVPVGLLAVDPESLLAAARRFVGGAGPLR